MIHSADHSVWDEKVSVQVQSNNVSISSHQIGNQTSTPSQRQQQPSPEQGRENVFKQACFSGQPEDAGQSSADEGVSMRVF